MSKTIAVAGGSGAVGRTIVEALLTYGKHKVYVFSRSDRPSQGAESFLKVDYADIEATSKALQEAEVDTIISAISMATPEASEAQKNLVRAADQSVSTRRFVVSGFDMLHLREHIDLNPLAKHTFETIDELDKTDLEYTRVANGWFLDYYGMPHWKTHLHPWINVINMDKKWAVVPGDGTARAHFITTQDMARLVARLMDLQKWSEVTTIAGDNLSLNEVVELAERTRGCKFHVVHDSLDKLKSGKLSFASEFPPIGLGDGDEAFYALIHYQAGLGHFLLPTDDVLNDKISDMKALTTAEEVMIASWGGK